MDVKMCSKCCKVSPISDHMRPNKTTVFKNCTSCRQTSREKTSIRRNNKKARLDAFAALQKHTPQLAQYIYSTAFYSTNARSPSGSRPSAESSFLASQFTDPSSTQTKGTTITDFSRQSSHPWRIGNRDDGGERSLASAYFTCIHCDAVRSVNLQYDDICVYCLEQKQQWCIKGSHEADESSFKDEEGKEHILACNKCREGKADEKEQKKEEGSDDSESTSSKSSQSSENGENGE